jgi:hypothetical protein
MASFKQGNITFENVNKDDALVAPGFPLVYDLTKNGTDLGGIVNAVDIDWNSGKVLDDTTVRRINTTGDLLYLLQQMSKRLTALESAKIPASFTVTPKEITLYTNGVHTQQITTKITYK